MSRFPGTDRFPARSPWPTRLLLLTAISLLLLFPLGLFWLAGGDIRSLLTRMEIAQLASDTDGLDEAGDGEGNGVKLGGTSALLMAELGPLVEEVLKAENRSYESPKVVAFEAAIATSCHDQQTVQGPFYCQLEETIYVDNAYLDHVVKSSIEAGELSRGYLLCRMMAQHLQSRLGSMERFRDELLSEVVGKPLEAQMRLEQQCEFFTGFLASRSRTMKGLLLETDVAKIFPVLREMNELLRIESLSGAPAVADVGGVLPDEERSKWLEDGRRVRNLSELKSLDPYAGGKTK